jgi:hypothetical protein
MQTAEYMLQPGANGRVEILSGGVSGVGSLGPIISESGDW